MDVEKEMDIFTSANFFIHDLDISRVSIRTLNEKKGTDWIVSIGSEVSLWFGTRREVADFAEKVLTVVKVTEVKEEVNSEKIS